MFLWKTVLLRLQFSIQTISVAICTLIINDSQVTAGSKVDWQVFLFNQHIFLNQNSIQYKQEILQSLYTQKESAFFCVQKQVNGKIPKKEQNPNQQKTKRTSVFSLKIMLHVVPSQALHTEPLPAPASQLGRQTY